MDNKYNELLNRIKLTESKENITTEENQLLQKLELVAKSKKNQMIVKKIAENNAKLNEFIRTINEKLKNHIELSRNEPYEYLDQRLQIIDNLNRLKTETLKFKDTITSNNYEAENELLEVAISSISEKPFVIPYYFNEYIAKRNAERISEKRFELNEETINKVYNISQQEKSINDLEIGTELLISIRQYNDIIEKCMEALSYKDKIYNNLDLIIENNKLLKEIDKLTSKKNSDKYAKVNEIASTICNDIKHIESNFLRRIINKNKLEELHKDKEIVLKRKEEYEDLENKLTVLNNSLPKINTKLLNAGLLPIMITCDYNELSIKDNIGKILSKNDLDEYYSKVEENNAKYSKLLNENEEKFQELMNNTNKDVKHLIRNDFLTALSLSKLNKRNERTNIDPKIALFAIKTFIDINNTKYENMNISKEEYNELKKYYDVLINEELKAFDKCYIESLVGRKRAK